MDLAPRSGHVGAVFRMLWNQWWLVTLAWYACSLVSTDSVRKAKDKAMITMVANLVIGWALVFPLALWQGLRPLRSHWHHVLFIAVLAGLEKNLTNTSLYTISASLKTALHTFNVVMTFFLAVLLGLDEESRACIFRCHCRGRLTLALSVALVVGGGVMTAMHAKDAHAASSLGIVLQLGSGLAFAVKTVVTKMLLGDENREESYLDPSCRRPTAIQIAFMTFPVIGAMSLAFVPVSDLRNLDLSEGFWELALTVGVAVTGILIFQLRLTKLTSALTVAVLGVLKDVAVVVFFLNYRGEKFTREQELGFAISTLGVVAYACSAWRRRSRLRANGGAGGLSGLSLQRANSMTSLGSAVEQAGMAADVGSQRGSDAISENGSAHSV